MNIRFDGKTAVVIGGSAGIGLATVRAFYKSGADVVFTGTRPEKMVELDIKREKNRIHYCQLDISDEQAVIKFAEFVDKEFGGADILFNNAAILAGGKLHETKSEDFRRIMDVNVAGVFYVSKYIIPQMLKKRGGAIVNTCSMSGLFGDDAMCAYNTSKGAIANLTRSMAIDYAPDGIRVNAVCPGSIKTDMYYNYGDSVGGMDVLEAAVKIAYPIGRAGYPEEVASAVLFLASDFARDITGVNLPVDGGITAHTGGPRFFELLKK